MNYDKVEALKDTSLQMEWGEYRPLRDIMEIKADYEFRMLLAILAEPPLPPPILPTVIHSETPTHGIISNWMLGYAPPFVLPLSFDFVSWRETLT
jgi:hypothetical protein